MVVVGVAGERIKRINDRSSNITYVECGVVRK